MRSRRAYPAQASARIDGEKMTDDMNHRARYHAFRLANGLSWLNRRRAAKEEERINEAADTLLDKAERLNRITRDLRDADAMDSVYNEELQALIKELSSDIDNGMNLSERAGKLIAAIKESEGLTAKDNIPAEFQNVFKKLLDSGGTSVFAYMDAIAKLDLDLAKMKVPDITKAITDNAATAPALKALAANRPLMLALSTLARNSAREMNLLKLRTQTNNEEYIATRRISMRSKRPTRPAWMKSSRGLMRSRKVAACATG